MAFSDELVHFVGENRPNEDPSEATSKRAGFHSVGPSSSRRRSLPKAAAAFCCLLDEEDEMGGGEDVRRRPFPVVKKRGWLRRT
ncbi:UNVERIFIED_CONTAM: hypothetical protein Sradi_3611900 [Sesamum radiatum]|uniref:Uncharacterized protein n=1 Tax=Sesamum radiatum TaxID=300843 RepID=A0AAW2QH86_SESRA